MLIAGIDEAGRGPVLGPLVMAAVAVDAKGREALAALGVTDSKLIVPEARERMACEIERCFAHAIIEVSPHEIDAAVLSRTTNLNWLEADTAAKLIEQLARNHTIAKAIIDSPTRSTDRFRDYLLAKLGEQAPEIICENKADLNHIEAGAASILAKVRRDLRVRQIEAHLGLPVGSGYLTDPTTHQLLYTHHADERLRGILRESWEPVRRLRAGRQTTLVSGGEAEAFKPLTEHGFSFEEPTNPYEAVRMKGPGVTLIRYTSGKLVLQGQSAAKQATRELLDRFSIG